MLHIYIYIYIYDISSLRVNETSAAMLSVRVGSVCNVNSHSLGPVHLGPVTFSSARLGLQCESDLRHRSAAARLLRLWVRIPPGAWMFVCCECRVLSGRSLCDELITRLEESYRLWCVVVCDLETSRICPPYIYMTLEA